MSFGMSFPACMSMSIVLPNLSCPAESQPILLAVILSVIRVDQFITAAPLHLGAREFLIGTFSQAPSKLLIKSLPSNTMSEPI